VGIWEGSWEDGGRAGGSSREFREDLRKCVGNIYEGILGGSGRDFESVPGGS